ncbi:MAG TPA: glutamate racemase [Burkholderiales bacterium]|nr:glutamate racemase [Pseudomonadota bacterium]HVC48781.1 glutamate racemase [Burkholderiales bacterium]
MQEQKVNPIGVFDSGVGGLTVVRALMERLPFEDIIYFGDTARVPYGVKSVSTITTFATQIAEFLLNHQVKVLIIACNTIAAVAAQVVQDLSSVPVLNVINAGARAAVNITHNNQIGILGTPATINSNAYIRAIHEVDNRIRVITQACPLFVPLVEEGWLDHPVTRMTALEYLKPVLAENIDTLVLGCTHYPLLKPILSEVAGKSVQLVDSAITISNETASLLTKHKIANLKSREPVYRFYVTDVPLRFQTIGERFLGRTLEHVKVVNW